MPHFPKPFFRKDRELWYVQLDRQINLGSDREEAFRRYGELIARPKQATRTSRSVAAQMDLFLEWCKQHRETRTYEWYRRHCQSFLDAIPAQLNHDAMRPFHVQQWVDSHAWNDGMKQGAMIAVKRVFNWLTKQGYIERSPLLGLELPAQGRRERVITRKEFQSILARYVNDPFADLLELAWETGARAQELWKLEARHVQGRCWVFPARESKGKRRPRIVHLNDRALAITQRLVLKHPAGKLLCNEDGAPWTRHAVSCRFLRLKKKINEKLCLTNFRHSYATRMIEGGADSVLVAAALGYHDLSMVGCGKGT